MDGGRGRRVYRGRSTECDDCGEYIDADQIRHGNARVDNKEKVTHKNHPKQQEEKK
jgi:hypothetical protein